MFKIVSVIVLFFLGLSAAHAITKEQMLSAIAADKDHCPGGPKVPNIQNKDRCRPTCLNGNTIYFCALDDPKLLGFEPECQNRVNEENEIINRYNAAVDVCPIKRKDAEEAAPSRPAAPGHPVQPHPSSADDLSALLARQKQITSEVNKKHDGENENKQIIEEEDRDRAEDAPRIANENAKCINEEYLCSKGCGIPVPPRGASPSVRMDINKLCVEYCQSGAAYCKGLIIAATADGIEYSNKLLNRLNDTERKITDLYKVLNEGIRQNNERIRQHNEQVAAEEEAEANRQYFNEMMGNVMQSFLGGGSSYQVYQNSRVNPSHQSSPTYVPPGRTGGSFYCHGTIAACGNR